VENSLDTEQEDIDRKQKGLPSYREMLSGAADRNVAAHQRIDKLETVLRECVTTMTIMRLGATSLDKENIDRTIQHAEELLSTRIMLSGVGLATCP
jgi:hypothetical protein